MSLKSNEPTVFEMIEQAEHQLRLAGCMPEPQSMIFMSFDFADVVDDDEYEEHVTPSYLM